VRIAEDRAWLMVKGPRSGLCRGEFEYEIPYAEAEEMLQTLCGGPVIEKTRYLVPHDGLIWEVDVYEGPLQGLILAEVELKHAAQVFTRPEWVGREVTGDSRYKKANLFTLHAAG
jgi:adenylate cyclase